MNDQQAEAKAQLKQLHESGVLNEAAYQAALAALEAQQPQSKQRNVKARSIKGGVATGDHARQVKTKTYIEHQHLPPQPPDPSLPAQERYLETLGKRCNILPLGAMGGEEESSEEVRLDQVYIALDTRTRVPLSAEEKAQRKRDVTSDLGQPREDRPLAALEAAAQQRRLVLLGEPGSGKSTFVRQLIARLARARLQHQAPPQGWATTPLPLLVVLHELAPALATLTLDGVTTDQQRRRLVEAVRQQWLTQLREFHATAFADGLEEALRSGNVLLVFDGLDEVAEGLRPRVRQAVAAVCQNYPDIHQVIITCRIRSYVGPAVFPEFTAHTLAPFDAAQIKQFIQAWYQTQVDLQRMNQSKAKAAVADLQQAALDKHLRELAANPMLLTTMAIIHQREIGLPRERVRLYTLAVQVLLNRWQMRKGFSGSAPLTALLKDDLKLRRILEQLAYRAHQQQAQGAKEGTLTRGELLALLEEGAYLGDAGLAAEFLDYIDQRTGLLVGHGGGDAKTVGSHPATYSFPHRTFQEYLAGCQMVQGRSRAREYWGRVQEGDFWYLAAQLGAEELLYNRGNDAEMLLDLAYDLCTMTTPNREHEWRALLWSGHMASLLGEEEIKRDTAKPGGGAAYLARLIPGLVGCLRQSPLKATERSDAGRILAVLGDPRPAVLDALRMEFCNIPAGSFVMGREELGARDYEQPLHTCTISYPYQMARYPVTNGQYQQFSDAGGYAQANYWTEAIEAGYWREGMFTGILDREGRSAPYDFGAPFTLPNHPAVGITWYEALAFTRWLTEQMHASDRLPRDWEIRLPSEAEWEKGARGSDGRLFPWGNDAEPQRANDEQSGIGHTSAVGCFPSGASPYGVEEMSGNIWEWTRSLWGTDYQKPDFGYPYDPTDGREEIKASKQKLRILRGGSWYEETDAVGCGFRDWDYPFCRYYHFGFRVVASPSTSGL